MSSKSYIACLWLFMAIGMISLAILPGSSWLYQSVSHFTENRWTHFVVFCAIASFPIAALKQRVRVLVAVIPAVLCFGSGFIAAHLSGAVARTEHNALADVFGVAAGLLLGANIQTLVSSLNGKSKVDQAAMRSKSPVGQSLIATPSSEMPGTSGAVGTVGGEGLL